MVDTVGAGDAFTAGLVCLTLEGRPLGAAAAFANRLAAPSPLYDISGWASSAAVQELFGIPPMLLNDDRLGRALEAVGALLGAIKEGAGAGLRGRRSREGILCRSRRGAPR